MLLMFSALPVYVIGSNGPGEIPALFGRAWHARALDGCRLGFCTVTARSAELAEMIGSSELATGFHALSTPPNGCAAIGRHG